MGEKRKILVFEDSDIFADIILEFLQENGFETERAINGIDGIKKVYSFLPELIITDIEMPLLKGYQASRLLKSRTSTRNIPIVMFTTLSEEKDKFWGLEAGADFYIQKDPKNFQDLKNAVDKLLDEKRTIPFDILRKEAAAIDDNQIVEMVNNLLDSKLYQTTVISHLAKVAKDITSVEVTIKSIFEILPCICQVGIGNVIIKMDKQDISVYTDNKGLFTKEIVDDFNAVCLEDFNQDFSNFKINRTYHTDFLEQGTAVKKIEAYIRFPLISSGETFGTFHIGVTIRDYFSPYIMENLQIFVDYISIIIHNVLFLKKTEDLRSKTRAAFSKYVPDDIIDNIIQQETSEGFLTGENRNVAILFSDIRDFTSISENNSAENVVRGLNNYFSVMVDIIKQEGGMIDKFIGDAILGIFGAPKSYEDNCARSLRAAIKMIQNLSKVNTSHMKLDVSGFKIGIGINYGGCILGNIGSKDKVDFTVIGDMVNLASRLEGLSKKYHHPIIVSDFLYNEVKSEFIFRQLDIVSVKGKVKPVAIYGVYSDFQTAENRGVLTIPEGLLINHNKALKLFYMKEWDAATEYFNKCLEESSEDYTAKMFLERIGIFKKTPPEGAWDGSVHLSEK